MVFVAVADDLNKCWVLRRTLARLVAPDLEYRVGKKGEIISYKRGPNYVQTSWWKAAGSRLRFTLLFAIEEGTTH
jgi:hypothetical protein